MERELNDEVVDEVFARLHQTGDLQVILLVLRQSADLVDRRIRATVRETMLHDPVKQAQVIYDQGWLRALEQMQSLLAAPRPRRPA